VAGCTGTGAGADTTAPVTPGTPFDPPSSFDLEQAVDLDLDQAMYGTLHGTVLYSVFGGVLQATDLLDPARSWSVDLPVGQDEFCELEPVVLDGTVLVGTGHIVAADDPAEEDRDAGDYLITFTGIDTNTHTVAWEHTVPARYNRAYDYSPVPPVDLWFDLDVTVRSDGVLIGVYSLYDYNFATLLVDGAGVRWQTDTPVLGPTTGDYAFSTTEHGYGSGPYRTYFGNLVVLDLRTGQTHEQLDPSLRANQGYPDPGGDESYAVIRLDGDADAPRSYLRYSFVDGTTEPFVPGAHDVRYDRYCIEEPGQAVILCGKRFEDGFDGVDRASGKVLWTLDPSTGETIHGTAQYHGYLYGKGGTVYSMETGKVVNPSTGLSYIGQPDASEEYERGTPVSSSRLRPIMVNEYGAVGGIGPDRHVWVPASH